MNDASASVEVSLGRQGRLVARFAQVPVERRLVDELIAERREESRQEGMG